jgi:hypothetical protein
MNINVLRGRLKSIRLSLLDAIEHHAFAGLTTVGDDIEHTHLHGRANVRDHA